jgi:hypothetical protein
MEDENAFVKAMHYEQFPIKYNQAFKSLSSYYKSIGFVNIPKISTKVMFINPSDLNSEFEAISFD